jgi:hypothetical protein
MDTTGMLVKRNSSLLDPKSPSNATNRGTGVNLQYCWVTSRFPLCIDETQAHFACLQAKRVEATQLALDWEKRQLELCATLKSKRRQ